eukprot:scaffold1527_cov145-Skeletonema_menzelii.AAC.17
MKSVHCGNFLDYVTPNVIVDSESASASGIAPTLYTLRTIRMSSLYLSMSYRRIHQLPVRLYLLLTRCHADVTERALRKGPTIWEQRWCEIVPAEDLLVYLGVVFELPDLENLE